MNCWGALIGVHCLEGSFFVWHEHNLMSQSVCDDEIETVLIIYIVNSNCSLYIHTNNYYYYDLVYCVKAKGA